MRAPTRRPGTSWPRPAGDRTRRRHAGRVRRAVRSRRPRPLLADHDRFWDVDTRALHHPVWFDQFGGFGVLARSADGEDVGYLLGVVTADRLAYLHLLAVRDDRRRTGLGRRLVRAFDDLALGTGARVVQAVTRPENTAAVALHTALGAGAHLVQDRAGPGEHRLVLTRSLAR